MTALLHLAPRTVTEDDVSQAWSVHRALILAEVDDPALANDAAHQAAATEARAKYLRQFAEWARQ